MNKGVLKFAFAYALVFFINWLVQDEVFKRSNTFIKEFQREYDMAWFFKYGHYFVSTPSYLFSCIISLLFLEQKHVFIVLTATALGMSVIAYEKALIRAPRPYFIEADIQIGVCHFAEFGSPSGHSVIAGINYTTIAAMFLKHFKASRMTSALTYGLLVMPVLLYCCLSRV